MAPRSSHAPERREPRFMSQLLQDRSRASPAWCFAGQGLGHLKDMSTFGGCFQVITERGSDQRKATPTVLHGQQSQPKAWGLEACRA